jgi:hypothetical protein
LVPLQMSIGAPTFPPVELTSWSSAPPLPLHPEVFTAIAVMWTELPVTPVSPVGPVPPVLPVLPVAPVGPVGPVGPIAPPAPWMP